MVVKLFSVFTAMQTTLFLSRYADYVLPRGDDLLKVRTFVIFMLYDIFFYFITDKQTHSDVRPCRVFGLTKSKNLFSTLWIEIIMPHDLKLKSLPVAFAIKSNSLFTLCSREV